MIDLEPIWLSLKLSLATAIILCAVCLPLAFLFSQWKSKSKLFFESLISLPIVLPPTVLGFYLLVFFAPDSFMGNCLSAIGLQVPFTFSGILFASLFYSLPFMLLPILRAVERVPKQYYNIAYTLGKSKFETIRYVVIPNIKHAILSAFVLTFAHTMGEFGVILMIGGNIPGETRVASLAIYDEIEALNYSNAHIYSIILLVLSWLIILSMKLLGRKKYLLEGDIY